MDPLRVAGFVLSAALAVAAGLVAYREREHRGFAFFAAWMAVADFLRLALRLAREGAVLPYEGTARVVFHVDEAIVLSWNAVFLGICLRYFVKLPWWLAALPWAVALGFCLDYPTVRGETLELLFRVWSLACLGASWACVLWGTLARRDVRPKLAHLCIIFYAASDAITNLLVFAEARSVVASWPLVRVVNVLTLGACLLAHVVTVGRQVQRPRGATS